MRIVYNDISQEFRQLLQSCMNSRSAVTAIHITRSELQALLAHAEAKQFLGDYIVQRDVKQRDLEQRNLRLKQDLERATTQIERQRLFDQMSEVEESLHKLLTDVPSELTQSGIRIVVTLKG